MSRAFLTIAVALLPALVPEALFACAACGFGEDESRSAYIATTVALSLLPLSLIGGFALYLRRKLRRRGRSEAPQRAPDSITTVVTATSGRR